MRRPPTRTRPPRPVGRKKRTDHWSYADEDLLRSGVWRYAEPPHRPAHVPASTPNGHTICNACIVPILAERRRMSVDEFLATVPHRFGGTQPPDEREERDNE